MEVGELVYVTDTVVQIGEVKTWILVTYLHHLWRLLNASLCKRDMQVERKVLVWNSIILLF